MQFGSAVSRANTVANPAVRFDSGLTALYAAFQFDNFRDGQSTAVVWYVNGFEDSRDSYEWNEGRTGSSWVSITNDKGLPDGFYELEIIVDRQSLYRGGVVIGKAKQTTCQFGPIIFSSEISEAEQPINPAVDFTSIETVYAFFSATGVANGTPWRTRWSLNGQEILNNEDVWDAGEARSYWINIKEAGGLPNGDYKLELFCNDKLVQSGTFRVTERVRQQATGVSVTGVVYDADNQQQVIEGATVYFLQPGVSVSEWSNGDFSDSQLYGYGVSNGNGEYQLDTPVEPGQSYSVVVVQDAYQSVTEDNYTISTDATEPYVLDVPMQSK